MDAEANKDLMRRFWCAFLDEGGALLSDVTTPDCTFRGTLGITVQGPDGMADYAARVTDVFEGFTVRVGDLIAESNRVVARLQFSGIHHAELFGVPATGQSISYPGVAIATVADDRITDMWVTGDAATWMAAFQKLTNG